MKSIVVGLGFLLLLAGCSTETSINQSPRMLGQPLKFSGATPIEWSRRMADSEIARRGDSLTWNPGGRAKWDYTAGLFLSSLLKLNDALGQGTNADSAASTYVDFAKATLGSFINENGQIRTYNRDEFQLDALNPGKTALALWRVTREGRYRSAAYALQFQLASQPRTFDGGFWHKQRYTNQMWLDGIYMAAPFYAECGQVFEESFAYDVAAQQVVLMDRHAYNQGVGLHYHGWDAAKIQPWANPATGCSSNFWGRSEGWYAMALVDILDFMPTNHPARQPILAILKKTARGIAIWQDPATGLWWQVMDQGQRKGNYLEATASAMFVYALAKGINHGYLSRDLQPAVEKGYEGIIRNLIQPDGEGRWSLTHCCSVAGLGNFGNGKNRDGSFDYYVSEPVVTDDLKGVGPFILAGIEMQALTGASSKMVWVPAN